MKNTNVTAETNSINNRKKAGDNMQLNINFSKTKGVNVNYNLKKVIRDAIKETLIYESFPYDAEVSVTLTDNSYIRELNFSYRGVDKHTDVLSFPIYDSGEFDATECEMGAVLGDIVISLERAKEQAAELGNSFIREVAFLAVHSTLHLLGYDHERGREDDEIQCKKQREIVERLCLK